MLTNQEVFGVEVDSEEIRRKQLIDNRKKQRELKNKEREKEIEACKTIAQRHFIKKMNEIIEHEKKEREECKDEDLEDFVSKNYDELFPLKEYEAQSGCCYGLSKLYIDHAFRNTIDDFVAGLKGLVVSKSVDTMPRWFTEKILRA